MKKASLILCILLSLSSYAQSGYKFKKTIYGYTLDQITLLTTQVDTTYYIEDMILKIWRPDSTVSDTAIAMGYYGYVLQPDYNPDRFLSLELKIMALNDNKEWKKALKYADSLISYYPTCLMGHVEISHAYNSLTDTIRAKQHRIIYERLGNMILKSGDGKSMETAYIITGLKDIEVLTQLQRMQIKKRVRKRKKKHTYEVVTVFKDFEQFDLYFDTSLIQEFRRF